MDAQKYKSIHDLAMQKIQQRLQVTPSIKEDLVKKFTDWFQGLIQAAKMQQQTEQSVDQGSEAGGTV